MFVPDIIRTIQKLIIKDKNDIKRLSLVSKRWKTIADEIGSTFRIQMNIQEFIIFLMKRGYSNIFIVREELYLYSEELTFTVPKQKENNYDIEL